MGAQGKKRRARLARKVGAERAGTPCARSRARLKEQIFFHKIQYWTYCTIAINTAPSTMELATGRPNFPQS